MSDPIRSPTAACLSPVRSKGDGPVFVVSTSSIPTHEGKVTLMTLAGLVARKAPSIYTVDTDPTSPGAAAADTTVFWLEQLQADSKRLNLTFDMRYVNDFAGVLAHFVPDYVDG